MSKMIELREGDVLIRHVRNGWEVLTPNEVDPEYIDTWVYDDTVGIHKALQQLLWDHLSAWFQSKHHGGLVVDVSDKGREEEEDE
ncbi:hypothetical protein CMI47_19235 [Candidatus Pacearchaeota archaeon]|nr:hypothetical protein [Candidatus Pacearchaeota archaeon]|tara:strand:+ start:13063 stop:13317 length:255 start_codon:yes stop_codon:yes gene_type:complete